LIEINRKGVVGAVFNEILVRGKGIPPENGSRSFCTDRSTLGDDAHRSDAIAIRFDPSVLGGLLGLVPRGILQRAVNVLPKRPVLVFRMAHSPMVPPIDQLQRVGHLFLSLERSKCLNETQT
jgi:hypothetical protein